jgi:hypothetical protein
VTTYQLAPKELWLEKLRRTSPTVAMNLETLGNDFGRSRRYAPLSGAVKYPAGARPSKCYYIIILYYYYGQLRSLTP